MSIPETIGKVLGVALVVAVQAALLSFGLSGRGVTLPFLNAAALALLASTLISLAKTP
jgi:urea transporter